MEGSKAERRSKSRRKSSSKQLDNPTDMFFIKGSKSSHRIQAPRTNGITKSKRGPDSSHNSILSNSVPSHILALYSGNESNNVTMTQFRIESNYDWLSSLDQQDNQVEASVEPFSGNDFNTNEKQQVFQREFDFSHHFLYRDNLDATHKSGNLELTHSPQFKFSFNDIKDSDEGFQEAELSFIKDEEEITEENQLFCEDFNTY
ncbi:hypothetical protein ABK040_015534 [Willaertia magna]